MLDAYSNIIVDDNGTPAFRLAALVDVTAHDKPPRGSLKSNFLTRTCYFEKFSIASKITFR